MSASAGPRAASRHDLGAGRLKASSVIAAAEAGAGLDQHLGAEAHIFLDGIGRYRAAPLIGAPLLDDADFHALSGPCSSFAAAVFPPAGGVMCLLLRMRTRGRKTVLMEGAGPMPMLLSPHPKVQQRSSPWPVFPQLERRRLHRTRARRLRREGQLAGCQRDRTGGCGHSRAGGTTGSRGRQSQRDALDAALCRICGRAPRPLSPWRRSASPGAEGQALDRCAR